MVSRVYTVAFQGIEAQEVIVEIQMSPGLPGFFIVGLPDKAVAESKERIRACFQSLTLSFPARRIIVNLAPADIQKEGSHYDLPIALALLGAMGVIDAQQLENVLALGELGLDGRIARTQGVLSTAVLAHQTGRTLICPQASGTEASWSGVRSLISAPDLMSLIKHLREEITLPQPMSGELPAPQQSVGDMADIKGQDVAKRALEIAASGGHHVLLVGPPGVGKSMLAHRFKSILPSLSPQEALEVTMVHSLAGMLPEAGLIIDRPFRDPHHSASHISMVGGGHKSKPGEISLAHHGVLFLDELAEFSRMTLESLRQPLETGYMTVSRANAHITYPAHIQLIAAMNPCRCGFFADVNRQCSRVPQCAVDYQAKISGPLMDRFDLIVYLEDVPSSHLVKFPEGEKSEVILSRVMEARAKQQSRYQSSNLNRDADGTVLSEVCQLTDDAKVLLHKAVESLRLSARGYHRVLRVARTIADLEGHLGKTLHHQHIAEALGYRAIVPGN